MKYKVQFHTKGAYDLELAFYSEFDDEFGVSIPDIDEAMGCICDYGQGYVQAMAYDEAVQLKVEVYGEDDELVDKKENQHFEIKFDISEEESDEYDDGVYILKLEQAKWQFFSFEIDGKYEPNKLKFNSIEGLNGLYAKAWTDMYHITYDGQQIEPEFYDDYDTYGADYYIVERRDGK